MKIKSPLLTSICAAAMMAMLPATSSAQDLPDILTSDEHYLPDFSYAGYKFGMEEVPGASGKVINVSKYGAKPNDGVDDTQGIKDAIAAANNVKGAVTVRFHAGKFIITDIIEVTRSDIVLQGSGRSEAGTTLYFPRPLRMVDDGGKLSEIRKYLVKYEKRQRDKDANLDVLFSEYSWTSGFIWIGRKGHRSYAYLEEYDRPADPSLSTGLNGQRGKRTIKVTNAASFTPGQRIQVLWHNRQGENGALVQSLYNNTEAKVGSRHWTSPEKPLVKQRTVVESVNGDTITIADTLLHDINADLPANLTAWAPLENVGVEDFRFEFAASPYFGHHVEQGYNGVYLTDSADSWVRNLTFLNADSGIISYDSANVTISDIRSIGDRPAHYAVHMGNVHNFLAERVQVFNPVIHSLTFNTQSTRSVYKDAEVFSAAVLDQHAGANHQNLFDNVTLHIDAKPGKKRASYPVFNGSGAGYWQPGHGSFNTAWNLQLIVESGAPGNQTVHVEGLAEGPDARIIGLSGNRPLTLEYNPAPYVEDMNVRVDMVPSLYEYQLQQRKMGK